MKKVGVLSVIIWLSIFSLSAFAQTKAVVIPLTSSKGPALQHYRIASQIGNVVSTGCETLSFTTNDAEIEGVFSANISILPTANDTVWWSNVQYTDNGGTNWSNLSSQVVTSGAVTDVMTNNSETALLTLAPNTTYRFRLNLVSAPTRSEGQCEIVITFNKKESTNIVTPAGIEPILSASGSGTSNAE